MGENQGMVWIILAVLIVAAAVIALGSTITESVAKTSSKTEQTTDSVMGIGA